MTMELVNPFGKELTLSSLVPLFVWMQLAYTRPSFLILVAVHAILIILMEVNLRRFALTNKTRIKQQLQSVQGQKNIVKKVIHTYSLIFGLLMMSTLGSIVTGIYFVLSSGQDIALYYLTSINIIASVYEISKNVDKFGLISRPR